jgi:hypothetical protein
LPSVPQHINITVLTLPPFESAGLLPAGVHPAAWPLFVDRFGTSIRRREQLARLETALRLLRDAGCARVFVGGSFVTAKSEPNDIDVAWDVDGVDADVLDPVFLDFEDERAAQKSRFGAEFFPAQLVEGSTRRLFLEFLQRTRDDEPVGIVEIDLGTIS